MKTKKYTSKFLLILLAVISNFSTLTLLAQEKLSLTGNVSKHSKPLENISVSIKELNLATYTDASGNFIFQNLKSGTYTLLVKTPEGK